MAIEEIQVSDWEGKVLGSPQIVVIDFWHNKCIWCKKLEPIYSDASEKFTDIKFMKLNILESDENNAFALGKGVLSTPTLKFFCNGIELGESIGFKDSEALAKEIERIKGEAKSCQEASTKIGK